MIASRPKRLIFLVSDILVLNLSFLFTAAVYTFFIKFPPGSLRDIFILMLDANRVLTAPWVIIFLLFGFYRQGWHLSFRTILLAVAVGVGILFLLTMSSEDFLRASSGRMLLSIYAVCILICIYISRFMVTALYDWVESKRGRGHERQTITGVGFAEREFGISTDVGLVKKPFEYIVAKRVMDLILGLIAFIIFLPTIVIIGIIIKITDPKGSVFFRQYRLGKEGKVFRIFKFRTMVHNAEELLKADRKLYEEYILNNFKLPGDKDIRITPIGSFLRKTSLDELPQILNVLKGQMSLVGPRPIVVDELVKYDKYRKKFLSVKPGITGWWQVAGRSNVDYPDRIYLEMYYVEKASFAFDLQILLETVPTVLFAKGAH